MKNLLLVVLVLVAVTGCGKKESMTTAGQGSSKNNLMAAGFEYLKKGDVRKAVRVFDLAIQQDPRNIENYMILGQVYMRLGNPASAVDTFGAAARVDPENGEAYYMMAVGRMMQGQKELALQAAQKSADIYMKKRDEVKFKQAVLLLQNINKEIHGHETASMDNVKKPSEGETAPSMEK